MMITDYNYMRRKSNFVYDILMDRVPDDVIVKGMMYWYFTEGRTIDDLHSDMHFRSSGFYKPDDIKKVMEKVRKVCDKFARKE